MNKPGEKLSLMCWFRRSIRNKLLIITGSGSTLVVAAALAGFWGAGTSINAFYNEVGASNKSALAIIRLEADFKKQVQEWKNTIIRGADPKALEKYWAAFEAEEAKIQKNGKEVLDKLQAGEARELLSQFLDAHKKMGVDYRQGLAAYKSSGFDTKAGDAAVKGMDRAPTELLAKASESIIQYADNHTEETVAQGLRGITTGLILMGIAIVVAFVWFLWWVRKSVELPTRQLVADLGRLANGDFTVPIQAQSLDEMGEIGRSAERIRTDLGHVIQEVKASSQALAQAASELTVTAEQVAGSSANQNEAAASAAASVEEMSASIVSVAEGAEEVKKLADSSLHSTQEGNEKVSELIGEIDLVETAMNDIASSVREFVKDAAVITNMTQQVKDIADQTNLLALNASIEAARAGEHGRGFAVVADEVRKLAEKSAQAASEIDSVTQTLNHKSSTVETAINAGHSSLSSSLEFVETVAMTLAEANAAVQQASAGMRNITSAVQEQSTASTQISSNIEHIAHMAEQNSMSVERTSESAENLSQLADRLQEATSRLRV